MITQEWIKKELKDLMDHAKMLRAQDGGLAPVIFVYGDDLLATVFGVAELFRSPEHKQILTAALIEQAQESPDMAAVAMCSEATMRMSKDGMQEQPTDCIMVSVVARNGMKGALVLPFTALQSGGLSFGEPLEAEGDEISPFIIDVFRPQEVPWKSNCQRSQI